VIEIHVNLVLPIVIALMGLGRLLYQLGANDKEIKRLKKIVTSLHHARHDHDKDIALLKRELDRNE